MPELKFFQEVGRDYLAKRTRALLADEMRLGKTAQAVRAADLVRADSVLVICPAVARKTWEKEYRVWSLRPPNRLKIVSYEYARDKTALLTKHRWDVLVLDEVHYLKSADAKRTGAILGVGGVAWHADRIWALSGTPAPNHVGELWPLLRAFGRTKMGYEDYLKYFCILDDRGRPRGTRRERSEEMQSILGGFTLRRLKAQVATELPKTSITPLYIESSPRHLGIVHPYDKDEMLQKHKGLEAALRRDLRELPPEEHAAHLMARIDEYATLRRVTGLLKTPAVLETVKFEFENGLIDRLVIFAYHTDVIRTLELLLNENGIFTVSIYGKVPRWKRDQNLEQFQKGDPRSPKVMIAHIQAAGTAIDLSIAHQGLMVERSWVPGENAQALERMGGYKQKLPVTVRDVILPGSIDELIARTLDRKLKELNPLFNF